MPFLHLGIVSIEKEAFGSPLTMVGQLINIYIYIYIYKYRESHSIMAKSVGL